MRLFWDWREQGSAVRVHQVGGRWAYETCLQQPSSYRLEGGEDAGETVPQVGLHPGIPGHPPEVGAEGGDDHLLQFVGSQTHVIRGGPGQMVVIRIIILKFQDLHWSGNNCDFLVVILQFQKWPAHHKVHLELLNFYLFIMSNMNY